MEASSDFYDAAPARYGPEGNGADLMLKERRWCLESGREGGMDQAGDSWSEKGVLWLRCGLCKEIRQGGHYKREELDFYGRMEGRAVCEHCHGAPGVEGT